MRIIARSTLIKFTQDNPQYADAQVPLQAWYYEAKVATWKTPTEIKTKYRSASILKSGRVVFNIAGNKYRLVTYINFDRQIIYIRFIGTHQQYDKIDANQI